VDTLTPMPGHAEAFLYFSDPRQSGADVAFQGSASASCPPGPCGVFAIRGGLLETIAESGTATPNGGVYQLAQSPVLRDGVYAFHAYVNNEGTYNYEIHADLGEGLVVVADSTTTIPGTEDAFYSLAPPETAGGRIVFAGMKPDYSRGIYQYQDGQITTLVDDSTPIPGETWVIDDAYSPVVKGDVLAFQGWTSEYAEGLFADFGDGIEMIAESMTPVPSVGELINWIYPPAITGKTLFFHIEDIWYDSHLLMYHEGTLSRILGTGTQLDGKTVSRVSVGADSAQDGTVAVHVAFTGYPEPQAIYVLRLVDGEAVMESLADITGDALPEVATVIPDFETGRPVVHITNPVTGAGVSTIEFEQGRALSAAAIPHIGDTPAGEVVVLLDRGAQRPITQTRDSLSGALISNQNFFDTDWRPRGLVAINDLDDAGDFPEIGVLAVHRTTGEIGLQIRDGSSGQFIRNLFFLNSNWTPLDVVVLPDVPGSATAAPEIGVLARHSGTGQLVVMLKDAGSNVFTGNVFYLNSNWLPTDLIVLESMAGSDGPVLALLARNTSTGLIVTMLKDSADNEFLLNLFHLGNQWTPLGMSRLEDTAGGTPEVAVLGTHNQFGQIVAQSKDCETNAFVANARPLGSAWLPLGMVRVGNIDSAGGDELAVLGIRRSDGQLVVQTIDSISGVVVSNGFLN
jgi:hypothetical protein